MTETVVIPFAMHSYNGRSPPWSSQRCVNWYAQTAPAVGMTKSPAVLLPRFGKSLFDTTSNGDARGVTFVNEVVYAVFDQTFHSVSSIGTPTAIGTIAGTEPVTFADNGRQICISTGPQAYVYTIDSGTLAEINDADFLGSGSVTFLDGYFIHSVPDQTGQFQWSAISDGTSYDALDFATAESESDPLQRVIENHQELWAFGKRSIEIWATTGNADSAFERIQTVAIERGCIAKHSIVKTANTLIWVADDRTVVMAAGYTPRVISNDAVAKVLDDAADIENVRAFTHVEDGHTFYTMTSVEDEWTWTYDVNTGLWHERNTYNTTWWDAFSAVNAYGGWLVAGNTGKLYRLSPGVYADEGSTIRFEAYSAPLFKSTARIGMSRFQVDIEAGTGLTTGQGENPQIMLRWSDDGGRTWSNEHWRGMGPIGRYRYRAIWRRLGRFHERIFHIAITDPIKPVILGAYADIEVVPP